MLIASDAPQPARRLTSNFDCIVGLNYASFRDARTDPAGNALRGSRYEARCTIEAHLTPAHVPQTIDFVGNYGYLVHCLGLVAEHPISPDWLIWTQLRPLHDKLGHAPPSGPRRALTSTSGFSSSYPEKQSLAFSPGSTNWVTVVLWNSSDYSSVPKAYHYHIAQRTSLYAGITHLQTRRRPPVSCNSDCDGDGSFQL